MVEDFVGGERSSRAPHTPADSKLNRGLGAADLGSWRARAWAFHHPILSFDATNLQLVCESWMLRTLSWRERGKSRGRNKATFQHL